MIRRRGTSALVAAPRGQLNHWVVVFDPKGGKCAAYCNGGKVAEKKSGARSIAPAAEPLTIEAAGQSPATLDELASLLVALQKRN